MEKSVKVFVIFSLAVLLTVSFVSAAFLDKFFGNPTGDAIFAGCSDEDGGKDYYTKSSVFYDITKVKVDRCLTNGALREFFCKGDQKSSKDYTCPNGCNNGRCKTSSAIVIDISCSDTDGGYFPNVKGTVSQYSGTGTGTDFCSDSNTVMEHLCLGGTWIGDSPPTSSPTPINCPYGCSNGACNPAPAGSVDTTPPVIEVVYPDARFIGVSIPHSFNLSIKTNEPATCRYFTSDKTYTNMIEFFSTGGIEHNSPFNQVAGEITFYIRCSDSLGNVNIQSYQVTTDFFSSEIFPNVCVDSDGGKNYGLKGTTTAGNLNSADTCTGGGDNPLLKEYYCRDWSTWDGFQYDTGTTLTVSGVFDSPLNIYTKEIYVREIGDGFAKFEIEGVTQIIRVDESLEISDMGIVIKVNSIDLSNSAKNGNPSVSFVVVNKYYFVYNEFCDNGCSDGACIGLSTGTECVDGDRGVNLGVKAITTGWDSYGGNINEINSYEDVCDGADRVREYYCEYRNDLKGVDGYVVQTNLECPNGCSDGACISGAGNYIIEEDFGIIEYFETINGFVEPVDDLIQFFIGYNFIDGAYGGYQYSLGGQGNTAWIIVNEYDREITSISVANFIGEIEGDLLPSQTDVVQPRLEEGYQVILRDFGDEPIEETESSVFIWASGKKIILMAIPDELGIFPEYDNFIVAYTDKYPSTYFPGDVVEECIPNYECSISPAFCPTSGQQTEFCDETNCGLQSTSERVFCEAGSCSGCGLDDGRCLPYGFRASEKELGTGPVYCDIDGDVKLQRLRQANGDWAKCQNNYECESNVCSSGECIEVGALLQQASVFKNLGTRLVCRIAHPISTDNFNKCIGGFLG